MDLSQIPLDVLKAEHDGVDRIMSAAGFRRSFTAMCATHRCAACPMKDACDGLRDDSPGWSERKERYLLELRAEIERRS